tara:strand:+ start:1229 stop:1441 length:213 start_codon:yes stop_codon:yes gene_type:complete
MARKEINVMTGEVTEHADDAPVIHVQTPQEKRAYEYPTIGDQLDDLYRAGAFSTDMANAIKAIKDKYPKE